MKASKPLPVVARAWALLLCTLLPPFPASPSGRASYEFRGVVSGGASFLDIEGPSYNTKAVPNVGASFSYFHTSGGLLGYGGALGYQHSFRSSDEGYYYYDSFELLSLVPGVELRLPAGSPRFILSGAVGLGVAFSSDLGRAFLLAGLGAEICFRKTFVHGILVQYDHGFLSDFDAYETLKAGVVVTLQRRDTEPVR